MKCRDLQCRQEAVAGDPRCALHKMQFAFLTRCAADELRVIRETKPTPPPSRKP